MQNLSERSFQKAKCWGCGQNMHNDPTNQQEKDTKSNRRNGQRIEFTDKGIQIIYKQGKDAPIP